MTIKSLTIENFRGFAGEHEVEFTDRKVAAFIGVNGSGKSTVLEAVAVCLIDFIGLYTDVHTEGFFKLGVKDINTESSESKMTIEFNEQTVEGRPRIQHTIMTNGQSKIGTRETKALTDFISTGLRSAGVPIPVFSHYHGTYINQTKIRTKKRRDKGDRAITYEAAFDESLNLTDIFDHYIDLINLQNARAVQFKDVDYSDPRVAAYTKGLTILFSLLENNGTLSGTVGIEEMFGRQAITYRKDDVVLTFDQLSSGEKMVIGMSLDIIYRCVSANPQLDNPLDSTGVILIDEIELHLHPRWQANIIEALTTTFPNIQFIISTHAPLVINQLRDEQLFILRNNQIIPGADVQNSYGMDVNAVVSRVMGAPIRPQKVSEEFRRLYQKLDHPTREVLAEVKQDIARLEEEIDPNDLELIRLSNLVSIEESDLDY